MGMKRALLMDTSVIIDGRIADIAETGFVPGELVVPRFVLNELQYIADSADALRRNRGRRGLEILDRLQQNPDVVLNFVDNDPQDAQQVDDKLISLARELGAAVLTNDYNLNRVARLQGVKILNINELANSVKSVFLPGEELPIRIIQVGKEIGQGVGYLEDGTMVVVENGRQFVNQEVIVQVTKVLQTNAGRLVFAIPEPAARTTPVGVIMALRLYNTLTRTEEDFVTVEPGKVSMYVCGPTVYSDAHVGHAMAAVVFDMVRRYLIYRGYDVRYATNFTDVDDKIIRRANQTGQDPIELANHYAEEYLRHLGDLNVLPADIYPRVSSEMGEIIRFIEELGGSRLCL